MVRLVTIIITVLSAHCCELQSAESISKLCITHFITVSCSNIIVMYNCPSGKGKLRINKPLH